MAGEALVRPGGLVRGARENRILDFRVVARGGLFFYKGLRIYSAYELRR